jgi:glucosyl-3-phosphoglycerate synthase
LVRAAYTRIRTNTDGSMTPDGGRLTELVARPLLSLYWPELTGVAQPLAGEWAVRRSHMESLHVPIGYGVELSTLLDTAARHGLDAIAQVQLGQRAHRHRTDRDMALAATELLAVAESRRAGRSMAQFGSVRLHQFELTDEDWERPVARPVAIDERPPVASLVAADRGGGAGSAA